MNKEEMLNYFIEVDNTGSSMWEKYKILLNNQKKNISPNAREFITLARNELGLTQEQMAKRLSIKPNVLSRYENGKRKVDIMVVIGTLEILGYDFYIRKVKEKWGENDERVKDYKEQIDKLEKKNGK